jgi:DNA-binding NtrC family response regulator
VPDAESGEGEMPVVLAVEDEVPVLVTAQSILVNAGYKVFTASTMDEALVTIRSKEKLDLLFSDIDLLGDAQGGVQLGKEFARSCPGSPVLYTTARGITPGLVAMFVEPHGFLSKPYTTWELLTAVGNLLNSRK